MFQVQIASPFGLDYQCVQIETHRYKSFTKVSSPEVGLKMFGKDPATNS